MAVAIISILASISVGGYLAFKRGVEIDLDSQKIVNAIRQTQGKAKAFANDDSWGIDITTSRILIFKGTNFSSRNQTFDINFPMRGIDSISGKKQIIFSKLTGLPDASGTLTLSNGETIKNIQINEEGLVSY